MPATSWAVGRGQPLGSVSLWMEITLSHNWDIYFTVSSLLSLPSAGGSVAVTSAHLLGPVPYILDIPLATGGCWDLKEALCQWEGNGGGEERHGWSSQSLCLESKEPLPASSHIIYHKLTACL
jgi:hypothetical protein